ncbi:MAG: glucose 1-dehydrogenase [Hyphomonadaceae bacterium]|nr:glucose 1-dehydrogenase [Hyphomonadaceae bacterium]
MLTADLKGKTALVTGASSGFGAHFSKVLAANGATVIAAARREDRLQALVKDIEGAGGRAAALALDVSDTASIREAFDKLGAVDILVNNAGVSGASRAIDTPEEEWRWTYDVNTHGVFFVAQAAAQAMIARGEGGSIINIASITALRAAAGSAAYASSKAAVKHMTECLALDWARYGIRVNAIAPGYFKTEINDDFLESDYGQALIKRVPQRRTGEYHELSGALLLLASDASSYMTGSCITVDGGHVCSPL